MMYKVFFTYGPDGPDDFFFIDGEDIEEIREKNEAFFKSRGLDIDECFTGSMEIKGDI